MEFINIWPVYIRGGQEGCRVGWVVAKAETKKQYDRTAEFRVVDVNVHPQMTNIPLCIVQGRE